MNYPFVKNFPAQFDFKVKLKIKSYIYIAETTWITRPSCTVDEHSE